MKLTCYSQQIKRTEYRLGSMATRMMGVLIAVGLILGLAAPRAFAQNVDPADIYVDAGSSASTPNGLSWATAYDDLADALAAAGSGDVIWVAEGTYTTTTTFSIPDGVTLYGGLEGNEGTTFDLNLRDFDSAETILTTSSNSAAAVANTSGTNTLDGFSVADVSRTDGSSGAGFILGATRTSTLRNMTFRDNSVTGGGSAGAVYSAGDLTVDRSRFEENSSGAGAGAMFLFGAGVTTITNSIFDTNSAAAGHGGAILFEGTSALDVYHSVFYANSASNDGGGIEDDGAGDVNIYNSIFDDNTSANAADKHFNTSGDVEYSFFVAAEATAGSTDRNIDGADPLFEDAPGGDFTLEAASLALNSGDSVTNTGIADDFLGAERTDAGGPDMGAYEMDFELDYGDLPVAYEDITEVLEDAGADNGNDAARHLITGPALGSDVDAESDGQTDAGADGDGDDDDGVQFISSVPGAANASGSVDVTLSGQSSAKLNAWIDYDDDGIFQADEQIFDDETLSNGSNILTYDAPAGVGTNADVGARFRVTTASGTDVDGYAADGEVEDYLVSTVALTALAVTSPASQNASILIDGTDVVVEDAAGNELLRVDYATAGSITYTGTDGNDVLTIDGDVLRNVDITANLGDGVDSIVVNDFSATPQASVTHTFTNENDGSVVVNGANTLTYTGLDPIVDNMSAIDRTFTFSSTDDLTITVSPDGDGASDNNVSHIDSGASEEVSFVNPTSSLTINAGSGDNTIVMGALDTDSGTGPSIDVEINGDSGGDTITVTPSLTASIEVNGGAPGTCVDGDVLLFDLSNGAVVDNDSGSAVSFSSAHLDVDYTGMESVIVGGSAVVELSLSQSIIYTTEVLDDGAGTALVITVTNNSGNTLSCVTAEVPLDIFNTPTASSPDGILTSLTATDSDRYTVSQGTYDPTGTDSTWAIGSLADGAEATMTIEGVVDHMMPHSYEITASVLGGDDEEVTLVHNAGFQFPAKAHVNAAIYLTRTFDAQDEAGTGTVTYTEERLIVGLFNGSPGKEGAVWCKIDGLIDEAGGAGDRVFPQPELDPPITDALAPDAVGNLWRPCAAGLPFPLHVNDFFVDSDDNLWVATWGASGLYKSEDNGETWEAAWPQIGNGDADNHWTNVYGITEDASGFLFISADNGLVYRSIDGGSNWQQVVSLPGGAADTPWSILAHPTEAGVVYAGTFGRGVYMTNDFGFTWQEMDDPSSGSNENEELYDDNDAGHIFSMAIESGEDFLYVGTGNGVWRVELDTDFLPDSDFEFLGPEVTQGASTYRPEIRALTLVDDDQYGTTGGADQDLIAGAWGKFLIDGELVSAFLIEDPNGASGGSDATTELALRGVQVSFIEAAQDGRLFIGTSAGMVTMEPSNSGVSTTTEPEPTELPESFSLKQNYPNPFNPSTTIGFALPQSSDVRLAVYDVLGREVAILANGTFEAGNHEVTFSARNLPSGTYIYRLDTEQGSHSRQLVLMK